MRCGGSTCFWAIWAITLIKTFGVVETAVFLKCLEERMTTLWHEVQHRTEYRTLVQDFHLLISFNIVQDFRFPLSMSILFYSVQFCSHPVRLVVETRYFALNILEPSSMILNSRSFRSTSRRSLKHWKYRNLSFTKSYPVQPMAKTGNKMTNSTNAWRWKYVKVAYSQSLKSLVSVLGIWTVSWSSVLKETSEQEFIHVSEFCFLSIAA